MRVSVVFALAVGVSVAAEAERELSGENPNNCKHFDPPGNPHPHSPRPAGKTSKFIVYGDSNSDAGRRYMSDNSYQFPDIGPFPWTKLYDAGNPDELIDIYRKGSASNGAVWPRFLNIPDDQNYATSSGSASAVFRSTQNCKGYTGDNTEDPTGTFDEQITQYLKEHPSPADPTRAYTHIVGLGANDIKNAVGAQQRWSAGIEAGLPNYNLADPASLTDPVDFSEVFKVEDGKPAVADYEPLVQQAVESLVAGVGKLLTTGVTGKILLTNLPSPKDVPVFVASGFADQLDELIQTANFALAGGLFQAFPENVQSGQVQLGNLYQLTKALSEKPSLFTNAGFTNLREPCMIPQFFVDQEAEVMQTQSFRQGGQGLAEGACGDNVCALCETEDTPCPKCWQGNPTATVCDCPNDHVWYDEQHTSAAFNKLLARTFFQCSQDAPNMNWPWVEELCGSSLVEMLPPVAV